MVPQKLVLFETFRTFFSCAIDLRGCILAQEAEFKKLNPAAASAGNFELQRLSYELGERQRLPLQGGMENFTRGADTVRFSVRLQGAGAHARDQLARSDKISSPISRKYVGLTPYECAFPQVGDP